MTTKNFQPFCVDFTLKSPMQMPRYPIMLDGLVYYMIQDLHNIENDDGQVIEILDDLLDKDNGVYKASSGILLRTPTQGINKGIAVHPTVMNWEDFNYRLPKRKVLVTKSGPYRARMGKYNTITCAGVRFYGVGDIEALKFYLEAVFGLGKSVPQGYGEVKEMTLQPTSIDQSWIGDDTGSIRLHRHLPFDIASQLSEFDPNVHDTDYRSLLPPYPLNQPVLCQVSPAALIAIDDSY